MRVEKKKQIKNKETREEPRGDKPSHSEAAARRGADSKVSAGTRPGAAQGENYHPRDGKHDLGGKRRMPIWSPAGSREELMRLPSAAGGPFGEDPGPWYKRRSKGAPRGYSTLVGFVSVPLSGWAASGLHGLDRIVIGFLVLVAPSWALESWWKQRTRQREDRLLPELGRSP
jgi:hypothetical protein